MDQFIIGTAKTLGCLVMLCVCGLAFALLLQIIYHIRRQIISWRVIKAAITEYKKSHPEEFAKALRKMTE